MQFRFTGIVVLLSSGLALTGIHAQGQLWPILPGTIALGALTLIFSSRRLGPSSAWLIGACGLLLTHTSIALLYPETLSVIDPDAYAVWVQQVINSGSLSQAETQTYTALPVFLLLTSTASEIVGLPPRTAFGIIPILVSFIVPLFTAWFTAGLTGTRSTEWPAVPAALLTSILTMTVVSGYRPIAMTVSYLLLFLAFVVSIRFFLWQNKADLVAFTVLGFGVTISHRFTILLLALGVTVQGVVLAITRYPRRFRSDYLILPLIGMTFLALQWIYIHSSLSVTFYQFSQIIAAPEFQINPSELNTTAARPAIKTRLIGIVARRGHGIVLLPIAGISWLYFASVEHTQLRGRVILALATAALVGAFLPLSIAFSSQLQYTRTIAIAEPMLIALAVGCGWIIWRALDSHSDQVMQNVRASLLLLGVLLIFAQVGSAPISADHPANYRGYLNSDEVMAKSWGHQHVGTTISADPFFAHERPLPEALVDSNGRVKEDYRQQYKIMLEPYTSQSMIEACPEAVLYREIRIYRSPRAQVLQWNPEQTFDVVYSRAYDAGGIQFYTDPNCQ